MREVKNIPKSVHLGLERAMKGAFLISGVNANARSDQEFRANVHRFFGGFLALVFLMDIGFAMDIVWMSYGMTGGRKTKKQRAIVTKRRSDPSGSVRSS